LLKECVIYIHSQKPIVHQDLKPDNILISNGIAKIGDFGLSTHVDSFSSVKGSCKYCSPESIGPAEKYDCMKGDVWSFGVVICELVLRERPFKDQNLAQILDRLRSGERPYRMVPDLFYKRHEIIQYLVDGCLTLNTERRLTFPEIVQKIQRILEQDF